MFDFVALAKACAPHVHPETLVRLVHVESSFNPYAIGVVGGRLDRQPTSLDSAISAVEKLEAAGKNYSLGLAQINKRNLKAYGLTPQSVFDPCENLKAGAAILSDCFQSAKKQSRPEQHALRDALSCYYSGDHRRGYRLGYVAKIEAVTIGTGPRSTAIPGSPSASKSLPGAVRDGEALPVTKNAVPGPEPGRTSSLLF